jgi:hypothetical protein
MPDRTAATDAIRRTWRLACLREGIDLNAAAKAGSDAYCASHIACGGGGGDGCGGGGDQGPGLPHASTRRVATKVMNRTTE